MLRNLIRSLVIRSLITIGLNLSRGQLLKRNSRLNRLLSIINLDINRGLTISRLRGELSLTSTQNSLTVLRHQLRIQVVLLTNNQTLISHSVSNNRTINNTSRTLSKLSLSLNRRLLSRWVRATSTIVRQSGLINWDYSLTKTFTNIPIAVRTDNGNKSISRLTLNSHRRVSFKHCINIAFLTSVTYDPQTRERSELFLTARKSLEAVGVGSTAPPNHPNSLCTTRTVRD